MAFPVALTVNEAEEVLSREAALSSDPSRSTSPFVALSVKSFPASKVVFFATRDLPASMLTESYAASIPVIVRLPAELNPTDFFVTKEASKVRSPSPKTLR